MIHTDNTALIVVDYQNGFIPETASGVHELPVQWAENLAPEINRLMKEIKIQWGLNIATRDWHSLGHMSLAKNYKNRKVFDQIDWDDVVNGKENTPKLSQRADFTLEDLQWEFWAGGGKQVLWPDHCIAGTPWAEYFKQLDTALIDTHIIKWYDARTEMYSWFFGKQQREDTQIIQLREILKNAGVGLVKIVGVATDYCIHATAIDALKNGFDVQILTKAIAGVSPEDSIKRLEELRNLWAEIVK